MLINYGVLGTFRLDADEGAKISTLNKVYDRNKHLTELFPKWHS
jgi:hypothetical protein